MSSNLIHSDAPEEKLFEVESVRLFLEECLTQADVAAALNLR